jgi:tripartite-type tricarboxylate transporter receptor subunit TctC
MTVNNRRAARTLGVILALCGWVSLNHAWAEFPDRPIRIVNPFPAGGPVDVLARIIAPRLGERLGQPVLVESRPGANGNIATEHVVRAPADGHTLLLASDGQIVISPHLYRMSVDPLVDLVPVATVGSTDLILVVNAKLPVRDLAEFIALARQTNPPLYYGSVGSGSQLHLVMELFKQRAGIDLVHVPYRGGEAAAMALNSGEVQAGFGGNATADRIRDGTLRGLASAGKSRSAAYLNLPTLAETFPGFEAQAWVALFAPAGVPSRTLRQLRIEMDLVLAEGETIERLRRTNSFDVYRAALEEFSTRMRAEYTRYGDVVKRVGLTID